MSQKSYAKSIRPLSKTRTRAPLSCELVLSAIVDRIGDASGDAPFSFVAHRVDDASRYPQKLWGARSTNDKFGWFSTEPTRLLPAQFISERGSTNIGETTRYFWFVEWRAFPVDIPEQIVFVFSFVPLPFVVWKDVDGR